MNNACFVMRTICTVAMVGIGSPTWAGDFANSRTNGILRSLGIGHSAGYHARQEWNPHAPSAWPVRSPYPYQHATDVIGRGRPGPGNCGPNCQGLDADMISSGASQFHSVMDDGGTIFIQDGIVYGPGIGVPPVVSSPEGSSRLIDSTDDHSQETLGAPPKELIFEKPAPDAVDSNSKRPSRDATDSPSDRLNLDREDDSDGDRNNIDSDDRLDRRAPSGLLPNPDAENDTRESQLDAADLLDDDNLLAPEERDSPNSGNLDSDSLEGDDDLLAPEEASLLRRDAGRGELDNWSPIAPANPVQLNGEHLLRDASRSNRLLPPPVEQHSPDGLLKPDPRLERLPPVLKATRADLWW